MSRLPEGASVPAPPARRAGALSWKTRLAIGAGTLFIRALGATWRMRVVNGHHIEALDASNTAFIFALWHGQLLPLLWHHRGRRVALLISEHRDGEVIARIAQALGYATVRGSSSRGAERALLGLIRELKQGVTIAVTPDGPRGPAREFAPGALIASQRSGAPILPLAAGCPRAWRLRSWDGFMIPKPFATVTIAYAPATRVEQPSAREAAAETPRFQQLLNAAEAAANA